jgi:hypothetical protein
VKDDEYNLSFGRLAGYEIHRQYQYAHWMPPYKGKIFVLRRMYAETITLKNPDGEATKHP